MIAIGRALTGRMPEDEGEEDFNCFTCAFSKFERRTKVPMTVWPEPKWDPQHPDDIPDMQWRNGNGVGGGWDCKVNGDCSFLQGGEERGW